MRLNDGMGFMKRFYPNNSGEKSKWTRRGCVKGKQYDPTTDNWSCAHRCQLCGAVSYFPIGIPDNFCRRCGAEMEETKK